MKRLMLLVMCAFVAGKAFAATPTLYKTLETDGRGFILTDYQPKTGRSRIEYDLRFLYLGLPFGLGIANGTSSAGATNDKEWGGYFNAETRTFTYYTEPGDACANFGEGFCDTSVRHTVSMGQGWVSLDDKTNTIATAADDYTTGGRFALFAANFGGTTFSAKAIVRVAGIRIFEDDTLVRDWVPAKDANGTATLYDLVNGKFETVKAGVFSVDDTVDPTWEAQAANGWTVQPTVPASIAAGTLPTISLGTAEFGDGTQTATYTAKDIQNLPAGTYTQVVEVASMVGYRGLREELTFTVTGTVPTAASTAPTAVAPLGGVSVATHTAKQQEFIGLPAATRKRVLSVLYERERAEYAANDGHPQSVRLRWDGGDGACTIHVYRGNETTPVQTHAVVTRWTEGNFFDLDNLEVGRTYRWTVTNEKGTSGGTFATEDETPRLFNAGVVGNTRDLGGYVGLDGRRVRQGMFLRSRCFDTNERTTYGSILTATEEAFFCDFIGLKTEIDLRGDTWITKSFVPGVTTRVNTAWPLDYTGAFLTDAAKKSAMKAALNPIFDAAKYPIDVHCHSGQDRTGMYCFILEALLGVSEEDCIRDWEYSALGNSGFNASDTYQLDSFLEKFRSLNGATTQAKAETFMKWLGYSSTLIDAFREIMLENERPCTVTIGDHPHLTAAWTSGDGSVTNEIAGTTFGVVEGTTNVKVIFTAEPGWEIVGDAVVNLGTVTEDIVFGEESGYEVPGVRLLPVSYVDAAGEVQTKYDGEFNVVTSETRLLTNGWYAVLNDVAIPAEAHLTVQGDAHLILCDGASLTVADPGDHAAGISVVEANRLTIYGQKAGTGVLTAQGGQFSAGIGSQTTGYGAYEPDCGTVTINGGTVVATGGESASGIGCSPMGLGGHVAIHGGTVAATGGIGGAGLGGNGNSGLAPKADSEVVITGGRVSATGNNVKDIHFANISISGGVFARRPDAGWCAEHFAVYANPDPETCADYPYAVQPSCTVTVGARTHMAVAWTSGDGTTTKSLAGMSFVVTNGTENVTVIFTAQADWEIVGDGVVKIGTVTDDIVFGTGDGYRVPEVRYLLGDIPYRDWNGTQMTNAALPKYVFTFVTDETRELDNGWYAVTNDVVFPAYESLAVKGNAHLVLCDGASLTIQSGYGNTAVDARGGSLTIYGQEKGTGALTAMGGSGVAGIGGTVTINGGTVTATGGMWGAGIGGGDGGAGGNVTINGGTVTAMGGASAAGIGGGQSGAGGRVTIRGGAVSATGGSGAEDVGRGAGLQDSGAVSVSGGIFARPVQNAWLADDHAVIANQDVMTVAAYPWAVVPYPAAWPAADDAVKAKFGAWRNGAGAEVDLSVDEAQKAFLLNVPVTGIKELKIESIEVDDEGYATIVVSAPGAFFFDRLDLGEINGVLYVLAGDTLDTMEPKSVAHWTTTMGKAMIKVKENFIRAVLGFKTPDVAADDESGFYQIRVTDHLEWLYW